MLSTHRLRWSRGGAAVAAAAGLALTPAAVAQAAPNAHATTCASPQVRLAHALSSLRYPWRRLGYRVVAVPPRNNGLLALTTTGTERRTEVYVESCAQESDALLRHVVAHEIGHAIDAELMTDASRARWLRARHLTASTPWYACDRCPVWNTGEGDFVEVFSLWQTGAFSGTVAPRPSRADLRRLVRLIPGAKASLHW
jgi:hypothetical protein